MIRFPAASEAANVAAVGEAMVEMAPVEGGLYTRGFAGDTFNTLWHMAQVLPAGHGARFVTRVGRDALSDAFVAGAAADGLDTAAIGRDPVRSMGLYLIALDGVERSFHYWRGEAAARGLADDPEALAAGFAGAGLIHLSGITLAILPPVARAALMEALAVARGAGAVVSFDPNIRPRLWPSPDAARTAVAQMLALTDIALPSFDDEAALWGDATPAVTRARHCAAGVTEVVVKDGASAVWLAAEDEDEVCIPTPPVTGIRDTTGAGDGFNAGYLAARIMGRTPVQAVAAAQRLAAEVIRHPGARLPRAIARSGGFVS